MSAIGWVYFAEVGPYIKIGHSHNPERRVANLFKSATRYGVPRGTPLDKPSRSLIRAIPGCLSDEAGVHRALDDFRVSLEWFADEPAVREWIANVEPRLDYDYPHLARAGGPVGHVISDGMPPSMMAQLGPIFAT